MIHQSLDNRQKFIEFNEQLWHYYAKAGRHDLPWRRAEADGSFDPYKIMVSELMLQQTQVVRVLPKYQAFLQQFPSTEALANAELKDVLIAWSGLGYNRRAKFLWQAAQKVSRSFHGNFPSVVSELVELPGVGKNTAGAIMAYAFNQPVVFLETNIRTVYIHHFFHDQIDIPDAAISELVEQTLDHENPREFYWALMDYGSFLKQTVGNVSRFAKGYTKQSQFQGSRRQIRGQVLRLLAEEPKNLAQLTEIINDDRLAEVLSDLVSEGLIAQSAQIYHL